MSARGNSCCHFMKRIFLAALLFVPTELIIGAETRFQYPDAPKSDQVDDYHGTKVADPYRPLENPDAPESRKWIDAENKLTFDFLKAIPQRDAIKARLTELWDYEKFGVPSRENSGWNSSMNSFCSSASRRRVVSCRRCDTLALKRGS